MRSAALVLVMVMVMGGGVLGLAFWKNHLPWHFPPGRVVRTMTYLTTHLAETVEGSPFPELRPRHYRGVSGDALFAAVEQAVGKLGWSVLERERSTRIVRAVVTTPLLQFQDDVEIAVATAGDGGPTLKVRSKSRVGQGDLGTNTAHILALYTVLDEILPPPADATWTARR